MVSHKHAKNFTLIIILSCLVMTLVLNYFYGSLFYSRVTGQIHGYTIGKECEINRSLCEKIYFKNYTDKIDKLLKENRTYFSSIIISNDQSDYSGKCPCPYNEDSRGGVCGGRSSYSKGGVISYCYDGDVSDSQVENKKSSLISSTKEKLDSDVNKSLEIYHQKYTFFITLIFYYAIWLFFKKKNYYIK